MSKISHFLKTLDDNSEASEGFSPSPGHAPSPAPTMKEQTPPQQPPPPTASTPASVSDMLLRLVQDVSLMTECVRKVDGHMGNVGDVDPLAVTALIPDVMCSINHAITTTSNDLPREAKALIVSCRQLTMATRDALLSAGDCARVRKASYLEHLRKMKDVSNAATRNAVLVRTWTSPFS